MNWQPCGPARIFALSIGRIAHNNIGHPMQGKQHLRNTTHLSLRAFANGVSEYQDRIAKIISDNIKMIAERVSSK